MQQGIIISLGSVNADFQVRVKQKPGSTTTMLAHDALRLSGGKAANVAYLARKLGITAVVIAHVGDDDLQEQALGSLKEAGIDLRFVRKIKNTPTGLSMISVPPDGKKQIILAPNANDCWEEEDSINVHKAIEEAPEGSVLVVDYEVPPFIVEEAIKRAKKREFPVILDPSPPERVDRQLYNCIDFIVPDVSETEGLTGIKPDTIENAVQAARKLRDQGIKHVLVKLDKGGCVVAAESTIFHVPAIQVRVVDTTGAGDAFAGALAVAVLERKSIEEAACIATAGSLCSVSTYGSQPSYPTRKQIQEMVERISDRIQNLD